MLLSLDCGINVRAIFVECSYTYGGLLEGSPNEDVNNWILQSFQRKLDEIWGGKKKNHLLLPKIDYGPYNFPDEKCPLLPKIRMIAWLDYVSPGESFTQLIVGWFTRTISDRPLVEIIQQDLHSLPWHKLAEEYEP